MARRKGSPKVMRPTAGDYLKDLRKLKGVEEADFAMWSDDISWTSPVTSWMPTGSLAIDRLIGGGWPVGRIAEVASWEGVGKSTFLDQALAECQRQGGVGVLIDTESARDDGYSRALGVDLDTLIVQRAETIEDAFLGIDQVLSIQEAHVERMTKAGEPPPQMLIVWDSIGGTPSRNERDSAADARHVSEAARIIKLNLRRIAQRIARANAVLVFANHFYKTIGQFSTLVSYGGSGIRYFTSVRLWLSRVGSLKVGTSVVGHIIEAKLKKTRVGKPCAPQRLGLIYGAGLHNAYTLFEWGKTAGCGDEGHVWVQQRGAWSYLYRPDGTHEAFQKTFMGFAELLVDQPELYQRLATQYAGEKNV